MEKDELLKNEKLERILSPHPLSFMKYQSLCIFLIIWGAVLGWLVNFSDWSSSFIPYWSTLVAWIIVLLIVGVFASLITIRWSIFFMYLGVVLGGVGIIFWLGWQDSANAFIPLYTISISVLGFLLVEWYRRSHKYVISNQRIIFKGGIVTKEERTLRYDKISDINAKQGVLGQIFHFGTIIPISQSGFGLGADKAFAAGGVEVGTKKTKLFGFAGGEREVQTPRARSYFELHGVHPYSEVKKIVEELVQGNVITQYQKEQVDFQKEQVDIQKQMRDLLKMQNMPTDEKPNKEKKSKKIDEEPSEPEETDTQEKMRSFLKMQEEKNK